MDFTLSASPALPTGATVKVFPRSSFTSLPMVPQGAPPGSGSVFTGTMGASSLTVTGLNPATKYVATANVAGVDTYVGFATPASSTSTVWRLAVGIIVCSTPTAAATGKYIRSIAVGSINTFIETVVLPGATLLEAGSRFKLRATVYSSGGAGADPTGTLRISLCEVTGAVTTTGQTLTPGAEVAGSALAGIAPTPRGTPQRAATPEAGFVVVSGKDYAVVTEVVGAAIPASTSINGSANLYATD